MGRNKPGKPRRARNGGIPRQHTLQDLQPPGAAYDEWFHVQAGMDPERISDPRLSSEALDLMRCMARLAPLYQRNVPKAAIYLDNLIDTGHLPILQGDDDVTLVPLEEIPLLQAGQTEETVRESLHNLHALGAFLVVTDEEHDVSMVRFVAKRPEKPGDPWAFVGDPDLAVRTVCLPSHLWEELDAEVATAVSFMRASRARLEEPDPVKFGKHNGINGTEHARELFAAALASGYVDYKGCEACPAGHLCTRS